MAKSQQRAEWQQAPIERIARSQMKFSPHNVREIDEAARKRLKDSLARLGLLEPIVWNRQTGNIVGGHQRIRELDSLGGTQEYSLDVSVVDLDEKAERACAIALDNYLLEGTFDTLKLAPLLDGVDVNHVGFGKMELEAMVPGWNAPQPPAPEPKEELDVVLVFADRAECDRFMAALKLSADEKYISGELVAESLT